WVSTSRVWIVRLFWAVLLFASSYFGAQWSLHNFYNHAPYLWAVYSVGVMLFLTLLGALLVGFYAAQPFLIPVIAESAPYFSRGPQHVKARQQIREPGVELLDRLHDPDAGYERVIIVAPSLGTAVGYELLMDYWARSCGTYVMETNDDACRAFRAV